jgi:protein involved in ribonucleotide reduction
MNTRLFLSFKSDAVPGAHPLSTDRVIYPIENELIFDFFLTAKIDFGALEFLHKPDTRISPFEFPGTPVVIPGPSDPKAFDDTAKAYICDTVNPSNVKDVLEAQKRGQLKLHLTIRLWWKKFFKEMLLFLTRTDGDTFNLARPDKEADVLNSFTHALNAKSVITITHLDDQIEFKNIPCELKARNSDDKTFQNLEVALRLDQLPAADHKNIAITLIAADWTKLYAQKTNFDKKTTIDKNRPAPWFLDTSANFQPVGIERALQTWESNIARYLFTHTSLARGQKIIDEIIGNATASMSKPILDVVKQIRDDIDARMITANHWGDLREDPVREKYQKKLSDLFGEIHQGHWYASPVRFLRAMSGGTIEVDRPASATEQVKLLALTDKGGFLSQADKWAQLILQFGTGHCGEHSVVSFFIIKTLMDSGNEAKFVSVTATGNANVDHAFVVGGIQIGEKIVTKNRKAFSPGGIGKTVALLDLEFQLVSHKGADGWVLDPYLDSTVQPRTMKALLARLNDPGRGELATKFLTFRDQHKPNPDIVVVSKPEGVPGV